MKFRNYWAVIVFASLIGCGSDNDSDEQPTLSSKQMLGDSLFHDKNLSKNGTQSCASCHDPEAGFTDQRDEDGLSGNTPYAASLGDDALSLGDRNAPTAAYAALIPEFSKSVRQRQGQQQVTHGSYTGYLGGQFWDGRESNLAGQAGGPPTNPLEMGMTDKAAVVEVLTNNSEYVEAFEYLYGSDIFNETDAAYGAMADAIAEFESNDGETFFPFDSKYDRTLAFPVTYQYPYESKASIGETLFFSSDFSCAACHQLNVSRDREEAFTGFEYHNIGVPENIALKNERNNRGIDNAFAIDLGLANNPNVLAEDVDDSKGKFKVPTLRNIAVTAPYMHNGVFNTLEGVLAFYEHARIRGRGEVSAIENPETNTLFTEPEVDLNIAHDLLKANSKSLLDDGNLEALECFLMTLTDEKYEHLLDPEKVASCNI